MFWRMTSYCLILLAVTPSVAAAPAEPVSLRAPWSQLELQGNVSFTSDEIVEALRSDFRSILALYGDWPIDEQCRRIAERVTAGYLRAGFADVSVRARHDTDSGHMVIVIEEGPRYRQGDIKITGTPPVSTESLVKALTKPQRPDTAVKPVFRWATGAEPDYWIDEDGDRVSPEAAVWNTGEEAQIVEGQNEVLCQRIVKALADLGYLHADVQVNVLPQPDRHVMDVEVQIHDPGQSAEVEAITIAGAQRNTQQAILDYLQIAPGCVWTLEERLRIEHLLWLSGRFIDYEVSFNLAESLYGDNTLLLAVQENSDGPTLSQPLSREEQALMKAGQWLERLPELNQDIVLAVQRSTTDELARLILSPQHGLIAGWGESDDPERMHYAAVRTVQSMTQYYALQAHKAAALLPEEQLLIDLKMSGRVDREDHFNVGFNFYPGHDAAAARRVRLAIHISPVVCFIVANGEKSTHSWRDSILTIRSADQLLVLDERTGELLDVQFCKPPPHELNIMVAVRPGVFQQYWRALAYRAERHTELYEDASSLFLGNDPGTGIGIIMSAAAADEIDFAQLKQATLAAATRTNVQAYWMRGLASAIGRRRFAIPLGSFNEPLPDWDDLAAAAIVEHAEDLLPAESHACAALRGTALAYAGQGHEFYKLAARMQRPGGGGALYCLYWSWILERYSPEAAERMAAYGLDRLTLEAFQADYQPLLDERGLCGQFLAENAQILRELDETWTRRLFDGLPEGVVQSAVLVGQQLRAEADQPASAALPQALDAAWEAGLREIIKSSLERAQYAAQWEIQRREQIAEQQKSKQENADESEEELDLSLDSLKLIHRDKK